MNAFQKELILVLSGTDEEAIEHRKQRKVDYSDFYKQLGRHNNRQSEETRKQISESLRSRPHKEAIRVQNMVTGQVWPSIKQLVRELECSENGLRSAIKANRPFMGGFFVLLD